MLPGTLFIASDHAGYDLKQSMIAHLEANGWKVEDLGPDSDASCDYPVFAHAVCDNVLKTGHTGILICGSGIGMSMAANRHEGIRAALCLTEGQAASSRAHNNANVLCLAARITADALARTIADIFLKTEFDGGRHQRRIELIEHTK